MDTTARHPNRRQEILSRACALFARHGYQGTSLRSIGRASGITEAAVYRHFRNKQDLYEAVIRWKAEQYDVAALLEEGGNGGDVEALLTRVARSILSYLDTDPELLDLMFGNCVESGPSAAVLFKEIRLPYINFIAGELERRMEAGEVRRVDPYITARCFVGMVMDCALSVGAWNKVTKFDFRAGDVIANNVPIFARGLASGNAPDEVQP
jgi:AcrR family transcriptional regulator